MKKFMKVITAILPLFITASISHGQNAKDKIPEPKTKLEKFTAKTGVVIIKGFQKIGSAQGLYNTSVNVESKEFTNLGNGTKEYGITIEAFEEKGKYDKKHTSYIDYDEIESLIEGIDYITGVKSDVTNFQNFQADYKTRGDLGVSTFSSEGEILASVTSGKYGSANAFYEVNELKKVRDLIVKAKAKIDELQSDTRTPRKVTSEESNEGDGHDVAEVAATPPKTNDVKASNTCELSLITLSDVMWLNADEQDAMKIKFSVTNNHDFPISGVVVEFKFYDIAGKKLADDKLKSFSESLNAGEVKKFDQFNLGKYPKDTMKVVGEVVSVSN